MPQGDWTSAYHTILTDATDASTTDNWGNQLKSFIQERAAPAADWGSGFAGGYVDTGRGLPGSARAFFGTAAPANLLGPDAATSINDLAGDNALDDGRLLVRSDQAFRIGVRDQTGGPAWRDCVAQNFSVFDEATSVTDSNIPTGRYIDDDSLGANGDELVWVGGTGTDNRVTVTPPLTGDWEVHVYFEVAISKGNAGNESCVVALRSDVNGAGWGTLETWPVPVVPNENSGMSRTFRIDSPTLNVTHDFTLVYRASGGTIHTSAAQSTAGTLPDGTASIQRLRATVVAI